LKILIKYLSLIFFSFFIFYFLTLVYSFSNIYLSFKEEDSIKLRNFLDKKELAYNFEEQLNKIIYKKIKADLTLNFFYNLDKNNFDKFIKNNIQELSFYLSDEKFLINLYKNPSLFKQYIENFKLDESQKLEKEHKTKENNLNPKKNKFKLVGPNVNELFKDTNYFFLLSHNTFKLDFIHKNINVIVMLNLNKLIWKISYIEIKF